MGPLVLLKRPFHTRKPAQSILGVYLDLRSKLSLLEPKVVDGPDPEDGAIGSPRADTVHECAACGAKVLG